jgi:hydroxymethylpyrimidine/phosphomethylpyrimidine kinase
MPPAEPRIPCALTIAGSDSGGGAGVQADLRTFAALEVFGASAITAITAQSTREVRAVWPVPAEIVAQQIDTVLDDLPIRTVKTGMLQRVEIVRLVAERIGSRDLVAVVDPVMVSKSGARLLDADAVRTVLEVLLPVAALLTPNLPEVEALLGVLPSTEGEMIDAGRALVDRGAKAVLVKGGHLAGEPIDVLLEPGRDPLRLGGERIATRSTHGTGCTYSAAIAAELAKGVALRDAVRSAHAYLRAALLAAASAPIGSGSGPVHHMHPFYPRR